MTAAKDGERDITRGQLRVLAAYANTGNYYEAAARLGITERQVRDVLHEAYARLGFNRLGKGSAINAFGTLGWLKVPEDL